MYKYINILITTTFFISLYVVYGNYKSYKGKKYIVPMLLISLILLGRFVFVSYSDQISYSTNFNYICEITIILLIMQLNSKEGISNNTRLLLLINYVLVFVSTVLLVLNINNRYTDSISIFIVMTTLCLSSIEVYTSKSKNRYNIIVFAYYVYICFNIVMVSSKILISFGTILNAISSVYIFKKIFKSNIVEVYNQKNDIVDKLKQSNITIKSYEEKLETSKKISDTIYENLEKKNKILGFILDQSKRCVLVIDDEGYILNEDNGFVNIWKEYEDFNFNININTFLDNSIKNKNDFISSIRLCKETLQEISSEIESSDGRFFSCTFAPFIIQNQRRGVICAINDITYKKNSEIKIKENDIKYKKIVDNIPYSILLTNSNEILYSNEKNTYVDFYKKDLQNIIVQSSTSGEFNYCNDGSDVCMNIDRVNFYEGEEVRNLIVIRDITDYKMLVRNIEYNKKRYEALVNIIPEGIYISDYESKNIIYSNSKFLEMLGSDNIHETDIDRLHENTMIMSGNSNDTVKFNRNTVVNIYGEKVYIESGSMLIDVNHKLKLIGIIRDITDQVKTEMIEREIEERKRANKIKDDFFINMSHELKTPLNLIYSSNQLIETLYKDEITKNSDGELAQATSIVKKHLYMLMALINNIMDLAKLESDFHYVKKDYYNIIDIIEDAVCDFNKYIDINNINIVFDTDEEEKIANVDPYDIEKIVLTLLSLVIRYSNNNSTINVDLESTNNKTTINISNTGGYDHSRYLNDQSKRNLDIGVTVAELIVNLYNGNITITNNNENEVNIAIEIAVDENITDCKTRTKNIGNDIIYEDYVRMCNF